MPREKPIRPLIAFLSAGVLAAALGLAPMPGHAQSDLDRWQAAMDPADHAHMLGNLAEAEDHYLEALKLAERFDRTGGYLERSMAGLGGLYASQERFSKAAELYRQALTIAEALYDPGHARHRVIAIYRTALAGAEAGRDRQETAVRRAQDIAAADRKGTAARPRDVTESPPPAARRLPAQAQVRTAPSAVPASVPARGVLPTQAPAPAVSELPPPSAPAPVLSHYRLAGAVVPPPPPAEVLAPTQIAPPPVAPAAAKLPPPPPAPVSAALPPAVEVADTAVPEAAMATAAAPPEIPQALAITPTAQSAAVPPVRSAAPAHSALPPAIDAAEVVAGNPVAEAAPTDAAVRPPETMGPPRRGTPPPIARPDTVVPEEIATVSQSTAANAETPEAVAEPLPAEVRSWDARPAAVVEQPVDRAAIRALAADPAAPPEVMVRAVAEETPQQIAQRKALEERHPVLGVRLGSAKRNMGPIYPNTPRLADTEEAYVSELVALERSLGPNHPDVAAALYRLARLYQRQSRYEPAGKMYERCLVLREKILPAGHPDIIETLQSYARLLRASGFSDLAAAMRKRAEAEKSAAD
ncbi:MAG: tetratricopeptide repeat protein [Rhodospirillales bacterium]